MILTVTANAAIDKRYVVNGLQIDAVNRCAECTYSAGGKGLNISRVAAIAGEPVTATGFLGGFAGRYIEKKIREEGVISDFVWCEGESRSCINIWDTVNHQQTEVLEPGFTIDQKDMDALVAKFDELVQTADVAAVSGSMPAGGTPELYKRIVACGEKRGKKVILDTSGKNLEEGIHFHPYMIKPNMDEIQALTGRTFMQKSDLLEAVGDLHRMGIPTVVISMGGDGSLMSCEKGVYEAHVPRIEAVNTVGCGDSMIGGFAIGISRGLEIDECLRLASAVSAAAAMTEGTAFFRMEDMKALYEKIELVKIR